MMCRRHADIGIAPFTTFYINPPHYGHAKGTVIVMNDQHYFPSMSISPAIPEIRLFDFFTLKIQGQGQGVAKGKGHIVSKWFVSCLFHIHQTNNSWDRTISKLDLENFQVKIMVMLKVKVQPIHSLLVSRQSDQLFLKYDQQSVWPWENTSEILQKIMQNKFSIRTPLEFNQVIIKTGWGDIAFKSRSDWFEWFSIYRTYKQIFVHQCHGHVLGSRSQNGCPLQLPRPILSFPK